jgi:hypothetical protein
VLIRPLPGTRGQNLIDVLLAAKNALENLRTTHHGSAEVQRRVYINWANTTAGQFRAVRSRADIDRLVLTAPFWHIQALPAAPPVDSRETIETEIAFRLAELEHIRRELSEQAERWSSLGRCVVPDTTMFIQHPDKLETWELAQLIQGDLEGSIHVLVPMVVVDELDKLKEAKQPRTRWRARYSLAVIDRVLRDPRKAKWSPSTRRCGRRLPASTHRAAAFLG